MICSSNPQQASQTEIKASLFIDFNEIPISSRPAGSRRRQLTSLHLGELTLDVAQRRDFISGKSIMPSEINRLAAPGKKFAYDVTWECFRLRFCENMRREDIKKLLTQQGIEISDGSISHQYWEGAAYLEQLHFSKASEHGDRYREKGFVLAVDATNEEGSYKMISARDAITGENLLSRKFLTDNHEAYASVMREVIALFGRPDVLLSDMCPRIAKAHALVFPKLPHAVCHYHFLNNLGVQLFSEQHNKFGDKLTKKRLYQELGKYQNEITQKLQALEKNKFPETQNLEQPEKLMALKGLIYWTRNYPQSMKGDCFPFELRWLHFDDRLKELSRVIRAIKKENPRQYGNYFSRVISSLARTLETDRRSYNSYDTQLREGQKLFNKLRHIFRADPEEVNKTQLQRRSTALSPAKIKQELKKFKKELKNIISNPDASTCSQRAAQIILSNIDKYQHKLCIEVTHPQGEIIDIPRTNNVCEHGFRHEKRKIRQRCGKSRIAIEMDHLPPQATLAENFKSRAWLQMTFGAKHAWELFHTVDRQIIKDSLTKMKSQRPNSAAPLIQARREDYPVLAINFIKYGIPFAKSA
jgi:hypothetical protein